MAEPCSATYDDLDRRIKLEEDDGGTDERHTLWQYDGLGVVTKLIADTGKDHTFSGGAGSEAGGDDQTTTYLSTARRSRRTPGG